MTATNTLANCAYSDNCKRPAQWRITELYNGRVYTQHLAYDWDTAYCKTHAEQQLAKLLAEKDNNLREYEYRILERRAGVLNYIGHLQRTLTDLQYDLESLETGKSRGMNNGGTPDPGFARLVRREFEGWMGMGLTGLHVALENAYANLKDELETNMPEKAEAAQ